jgi:hypothetical protein
LVRLTNNCHSVERRHVVDESSKVKRAEAIAGGNEELARLIATAAALGSKEATQ